MMYEKVLNAIVSFFGLKIEITKLFKPNGIKSWSYSKTKSIVYQIYITNYNEKKKVGSFGFWVYDENFTNACKKALEKLIFMLKWSYKIKLEKCLQVK